MRPPSPDSPISIIISSSNGGSRLERALRSVLTQEYPSVECIVVESGPARASAEIVRRYRDRVSFSIVEAGPKQLDALNGAFNQARGDVMLWLEAGEALCPWACEVANFVFQNCPQIEWLTSRLPMTWSRSQLLSGARVVDGYSKESFFAGRNLKSSPRFQHPIWRMQTFWTRDLWRRSGGHLRAALEDAGDFELWARFWQSAELAQINLPLAGRQASASPSGVTDSDQYWAAAAQVLKRYPRRALPPRWTIPLRRWLARSIPALAPRVSSRATFVSIARKSEDCRIFHSYLI